MRQEAACLEIPTRPTLRAARAGRLAALRGCCAIGHERNVNPEMWQGCDRNSDVGIRSVGVHTDPDTNVSMAFQRRLLL